MSDAITNRKPDIPSGLTPLGRLLYEFGDVRAEALVLAAYWIASLGTVALLSHWFFDIGFPLWVIGVAAISVSLIFFTVGKLRMKNRLFIYQEGITQIKWGLVETYAWRDITEIHLERATRYASGVAYNARYHCTLRRNDGSRGMLDAVRLTASVAKAICDNAPIAILHGEKDIVVDRYWH